MFLLGNESIVFMNNLVELFIAVLLFAYFIFSLLVIRQVGLLNKSFKTDAAFFITSLTYTHALVVLLLMIFTIFSVFL